VFKATNAGRVISLLVGVLVLYGTPVYAEHSPATDQNQVIAILIPSCDKYSDLWQPFTQLLFKYWPELNNVHANVPIYLTSNQESFTHPRIKNILIPAETNWSDSMRTALQQINSQYVLILLEDYLLKQPVKNQDFWAEFAIMRQLNAAYLQVGDWVAFIDNSSAYPHNIKAKQQFGELRNNLNAAIWDREMLLSLLKSGENAWEFEHYGNFRSQEITRPFLAVTTNAPFVYHNAAQARTLNAAVLYYLKFFEGIDLTNKTLKLKKNSLLDYAAQDHFGINFLSLLLPGLLFVGLIIIFNVNNAGLLMFASLSLLTFILHYYLPLTRFLIDYKLPLLLASSAGYIFDLLARQRSSWLHGPQLIYCWLATFASAASWAYFNGCHTICAVCSAIAPMLLVMLYVNRRAMRLSLGLAGNTLLLTTLIILIGYKDLYFGNLTWLNWGMLSSPIWLYLIYQASSNSSLLRRRNSSWIHWSKEKSI
jgi:hypothetical protein